MPIKHLSPEQMAIHPEKGICFNCDKKFSKGRKCSSKIFLFIAEEDDTTVGGADLGQLHLGPSEDVDQSPTQISFHELSGHLALETLHLVGQIANHKVVILIDGGSTHNFVQECLLKTLDLVTQPIPSLRVMVGNDNEIDCHQLCADVAIYVLGLDFTMDLHVLPLCGANLVLGVQWLKSLKPVPTDYNDLPTKFMHSGKVIELKDDHDIESNAIITHQLRRMVRTNMSRLFHIHVLDMNVESFRNK